MDACACACANAPVALLVRQVVTEVRSSERHCLTIRQTSHVVPHDLVVSERRPPVRHGLLQELVKGAADWGDEERFPVCWIVVRCRLVLADLLLPISVQKIAERRACGDSCV
jgi:hypothetical protein